ncbi:MAG: protein kinase [Myxococcota bacterium]
MANLTGTTIDKYEMLEEVGHGGMAVVYRGRDRVLDREVAVKVLHPHLADREESRLRLQREAIAVAKLRHDNILEIFDYSGPEAEESYIVTEFIHGPTLREWIERGLSPRPAVAAMIVHRLCLALWHAHKGAIVHRDIKPENVMIRMDDGQIKLMDFGIAQIIDNKKLTLTGQLIGSPAYMAPELISGRPLDARTDLFSLGILLYQLATDQLPFNGRNPHEVLTRIADGVYPPPSTISPLVDRDFEAIIDRALALNPDDRYQSVETFAKELEEYLGEMGIEPSSTELCDYFQQPEAYVEELDARVCAALLEQADKAGAAGSTARAIRLLGRVLELEPDHSGAKSMLGRFQARERRSRQLLFGAASLALAGLVGAGYMLMPPATTSGSSARLGSAALKGNSGAVARSDAALGADPDDSALAAGDGDLPATGGLDEPADDAVEPDATDDGTPIAVAAETGEPPTKAGSTAGTRPPRRIRPEKPPPEVPCSVSVEGLPASQVDRLRVTAGGKAVELVGTTAEILVPPDGIDIRADHQRYFGKKRVLPGQCPAVVSIRPKPARVKFEGVPLDMSVRCVKGCGEGLQGKNKLVTRFPAVPMADGNGLAITLTFQHSDYENHTQTVTLYPGPNTIRANVPVRGE